MSLSTLQELYIDELKDLYNAESQLLKALPAMAQASTEPKLKQAFQDHLSQTEGHVERLNEIFMSLDEKPDTETYFARNYSRSKSKRRSSESDLSETQN